jgi:hypothetical protein
MNTAVNFLLYDSAVELVATNIEYPRIEDAESIKSVQDAWLGARIGSEGFLVSPESLGRLREMIGARNILVARRCEEIVAYITFYRRGEWESLHPGYTANLDYMTPELRTTFEALEYVVIDHIARSRSYTGDAATRLVLQLKKLLREWGVGHFLGEISPENQRSAEFFVRALGATRIGSTVRDDILWDIYSARL